jgi:hypothetical protein
VLAFSFCDKIPEREINVKKGKNNFDSWFESKVIWHTGKSEYRGCTFLVVARKQGVGWGKI